MARLASVITTLLLVSLLVVLPVNSKNQQSKTKNEICWSRIEDAWTVTSTLLDILKCYPDKKPGDKGAKPTDTQPSEMSRFIEMVEMLESRVDDKSAKEVAADLRIFSYDDNHPEEIWMDQICGQLTTFFRPRTYLNEAELKEMRQMIARGENGKLGIVLAPDGTYLAMGQVIAGMSCGGFERDTNLKLFSLRYGVSSSHLDNLFFTTISGDIGRTVLGYAVDHSPEVKIMRDVKPPNLEMIDALAYGDMDGAILGTIVPMIREQKLSDIFRQYYLGNGIQIGGRVFSAKHRTDIFGEIVSDVELELQSIAAAKLYYSIANSSPKKQSIAVCLGNILANKIFPIYFTIETTLHFVGNTIARKQLTQFVPKMVSRFYKTYVPCTDVLNSKYTLRYFVNLVKELEAETKLGVVPMTRAIIGISDYIKSSYIGEILDVEDHGHTYTDGFCWYVLREMVSHGFPLSEPRREIGVIEAGGDVVAIGHVLAGIQAGTDPNSRTAQKPWYYEGDTLYGATVAGSLARAIVGRQRASVKTSNTLGARGTWDRSVCPNKYRLRQGIRVGQHTTHADLLGDIDGFLLGDKLPAWLRSNPSLKLSEVLELYYSTGINNVNANERFAQFKALTHDKNNMIEQTTQMCKVIIRMTTSWYIKYFKDTSFCKSAAKDAVTKFYKSVVTGSSSPVSTFLPAYTTLVAAYPNQMTESELRRQFAGRANIPTGQTASEVLKMSVMLNKLTGHRITLVQKQGTVIGQDKKMYIYDLATLKSYLTQQYKPPMSAASVSGFSDLSGILMLETADGGSVGLWNGRNMHQTPDVRTSNVVGKAYLWTLVNGGCGLLAEQGDCKFYKCKESAFSCGNDGYALAYGYRYCERFSTFLDSFDSAGKKWVDGVRKCLMNKLEPFYKRGFNCKTIKRVAFDSHVGCYLGSGFCEMAISAKNLAALYKVYEFKDFFGKDAGAAWSQVIKTTALCGVKLFNTISSLTSKAMQGKLSDTASIQTDDSSSCLSYAATGDCRFYQCFQRKFPCSVFDASHMSHFEFPLCRDMESRHDLLETKGKDWSKKNSRCLMQKLLPVYNKGSVKCADLSRIMLQNRVECLTETDFFEITDTLQNRFALDRMTNLNSYPALLPEKTGLTTAGREYFYGELSNIRHLMGSPRSLA